MMYFGEPRNCYGKTVFLYVKLVFLPVKFLLKNESEGYLVSEKQAYVPYLWHLIGMCLWFF